MKILKLRYNSITNINNFEKLQQLEVLDLGGNEITDASPIKRLSKLKSLNLSGNNIENWEFLSSLNNLHSLFSSYCQIEDIYFLKNLSQLKELDLSENIIKTLPLEFLKKISLKLDIENEPVASEEKIFLKGNPIINPPTEVIRRGREFTINYLKELSK